MTTCCHCFSSCHQPSRLYWLIRKLFSASSRKLLVLMIFCPFSRHCSTLSSAKTGFFFVRLPLKSFICSALSECFEADVHSNGAGALSSSPQAKNFRLSCYPFQSKCLCLQASPFQEPPCFLSLPFLKLSVYLLMAPFQSCRLFCRNVKS